MLGPHLLVLDPIDRRAAESLDWGVQVAFKHGVLLEDQGHLVDKEERNPLRFTLCAVLEFPLECPAQEQCSNQRLTRS